MFSHERLVTNLGRQSEALGSTEIIIIIIIIIIIMIINHQ